MALVDNDKRVQKLYHFHQKYLFLTIVVDVQKFWPRKQIAVALINFSVLFFAGAKAVDAEYKKANRKPRERKVDDDKLMIMEIINNAIHDNLDSNCIVRNAEKYIDFIYNNNHYTVNLVKHRKGEWKWNVLFVKTKPLGMKVLAVKNLLFALVAMQNSILIIIKIFTLLCVELVFLKRRIANKLYFTTLMWWSFCPGAQHFTQMKFI